MADRNSDGFVRKDDPKQLIDLCTNCKRTDCNGMKCDDYRRVEKEIKMQQKKIAPPKPRMEIVPLVPDAHEAVENASGLRLLNIAIDALDKLLSDEVLNEKVIDGFKELKAHRYRQYGERIDWHVLEDVDETEV